VRIVRVITRLNVGGPAIQAARLTADLADRGNRTLLIHGRLGAGEGDMRYLLPPDASNVIYLDALQRSIAPFSDVRACGRMLKVLRQVRPDIVHTHMAKAGLLGRLAALIYNRTAGRRTPTRIVHTYHGHVLEGYFRPVVARAFVAVERWLARRTDVLIAVSPRVCLELVERFGIAPRSRFAIVPLGFDLRAFAAIDDDARAAARTALDLRPDARVVTTVGRLTAIKNHAMLLNSLQDLAARIPAIVLLIAGDGELRPDLERQAETLGIGDRVRFLGWRRDLDVIYAATDVFALTSRNEGTPVAMIEAMAAGVPVVATDVGGVADVLSDSRAGLLVASDDANGLSVAIEELLRSPMELRARGAHARASVLERYDVRRLVNDIDSLYRSLLRDAQRLDETPG
jgi:glycosyltransferase involved in cell wall biosynthesis